VPTGSALSGATASVAAPDPSNATFRIGTESVTLVNGRAERESAPGSAAKVVTMLTNARASGDLDGDGRADTIVVLSQQSGGSGTFYYVAALLNGATGVTALPGVLLGDRIVVNSARVDGGSVIVDLLDRAPGQPLTASPTVATVRRFGVDRGALISR